MLLGLDEINEGKIPTTPTIASVIAGVQVQEAVKYLHNRDDLIYLNGKGFIFNGNNNDSYIVEYQKKEDCPSHYTFDKIRRMDKKFDEVKISDVIEFGEKHFKDDNFQIEFNNEVVYELTNESNKESEEFFDNMNLKSVKDVILEDGNLLKPKSFHSLNSVSGFAKKFYDKKLTELKIPYNDILILRKNENETGLEFENMEIFKS